MDYNEALFKVNMAERGLSISSFRLFSLFPISGFSLCMRLTYDGVILKITASQIEQRKENTIETTKKKIKVPINSFNTFVNENKEITSNKKISLFPGVNGKKDFCYKNTTYLILLLHLLGTQS